jgi:hypothetical protein
MVKQETHNFLSRGSIPRGPTKQLGKRHANV